MKSNRIHEEQRVVELMIRFYCRRYEGNEALCPSCTELLDYAAVAWPIAAGECTNPPAAVARTIAMPRISGHACDR